MSRKHIGEAVILLGVLAVLCCFVFQKEGYHIDELLSFELSNAEYNPWIVPTQPVGRLAKFMHEEIQGENFRETASNLTEALWDLIVNGKESKVLQYKAEVYPEPVWITREQFHNYLTTDDTDRFQYQSVYFNVKADNHPPLHYMLLHTMSSLFPGVISPLLGCTVNLLAIAVCILCFFRLGTLLEKRNILPAGYGNVSGICMGLLYGLSTGAIATVLLIRMYGVMTCFCVLLFYLHIKKWLEKGFGTKNAALAAVTVSGFLTQYFFLFYCLTLAAVTTGLLIAKKRFRELKIYLRTMILSAVIGVALFPYAIEDILSSGRGEEAIRNLSSGFSGYGTRLAAFGRIFLEASFGSVILGILVCLCLGLLLLLCRKAGKASGSVAAEAAGRADMPVWLMLILPCCCYFLLASRMSPYLVDRYIMPLFPFMAIFMTLLSARIFSFVPRDCFSSLLVPVLILGAINIVGYDGEYLYQGYERQLEAAKEYASLPCICLYDGQNFYYNLMEFTEYEETLLLRMEELEGRADREGIMRLQQVIVLRKRTVDETMALEVLRSYGLEVKAVLMEESGSVYGDTIYLCGRIDGT